MVISLFTQFLDSVTHKDSDFPVRFSNKYSNTLSANNKSLSRALPPPCSSSALKVPTLVPNSAAFASMRRSTSASSTSIPSSRAIRFRISMSLTRWAAACQTSLPDSQPARPSRRVPPAPDHLERGNPPIPAAGGTTRPEGPQRSPPRALNDRESGSSNFGKGKNRTVNRKGWPFSHSTSETSNRPAASAPACSSARRPSRWAPRRGNPVRDFAAAALLNDLKGSFTRPEARSGRRP